LDNTYFREQFLSTYQLKSSQTHNISREAKPYSKFMKLAAECSSKTCPTCAELRRLRARNEAARRNTFKHFLAASNSPATALLPDLDEELKQTAAARLIIGYTLRTHLARQHAPSAGAMGA
jgi:hypothetical protein